MTPMDIYIALRCGSILSILSEVQGSKLAIYIPGKVWIIINCQPDSQSSADWDIYCPTIANW